MNSETCTQIFGQCIDDYHVKDNVDAAFNNPYQSHSIEALLYQKCWIDTVQWHLEDMVRDPAIEPAKAVQIKRRIDGSNQHRTNVVEEIDDWFLQQFKDVIVLTDATLNTESPAWAIDRLSILELKIFHMQVEAQRTDVSDGHRQQCQNKLTVLMDQRNDLAISINQLINDIASGNKKMKVYRQMKMYNDASLNPVLYQHKKKAD